MVVRTPPPRRCAGDDGSALVEAAFISPIFFYLLFGILEFGRVFLSNLTVSSATLLAARTVAIGGQQLNTDFLTVTGFKTSLGAIDTNGVVRIVIWHPPTTTSTITGGCATGSANGASSNWSTYSGNTDLFCNVYGAADIAATTTAPKFGCTASALDRFWCPAIRKNANTGPNAADLVGVYVVYRHKYLTGLFGTSVDLTQQATARIEPQTVS